MRVGCPPSANSRRRRLSRPPCSRGLTATLSKRIGIVAQLATECLSHKVGARKGDESEAEDQRGNPIQASRHGDECSANKRRHAPENRSELIGQRAAAVTHSGRELLGEICRLRAVNGSATGVVDESAEQEEPDVRG